MDEYLSDKAKKMKAQIEQVNLASKDKIIEYIERQEFPEFYKEEMKKIKVCGFNCKGYGSPELSMVETGAMIYEMSKLDLGLSLFMFLQNNLGIAVFEACCDDEQKARFLPELIKLNKISCFGLTEPENGSDATNM